MSVDKSEVTKHQNIKDWWDKNGFMMGLHAMNDLRISLIRNGLERYGKFKPETIRTDPNYLSGLKIVDVGCGAGILCEPLARLGASVTGIDPSQDLINLAQQHVTENNHSFKTPPKYITSNIEDHASQNHNIYDALVASEVIEHVSNKEDFLAACAKTVKPGGSIFLTTPNRTSLSWLGNIVLAENVFRVLPKGIHEYDKFITPEELKQVLHKSGCETVLVNGMFFNVFKRNWKWYSSTMLHYALHAVKRIK